MNPHGAVHNQEKRRPSGARHEPRSSRLLLIISSGRAGIAAVFLIPDPSLAWLSVGSRKELPRGWRRGIIVQQVPRRWRKGSAHGRCCDRLQGRSEVLAGGWGVEGGWAGSHGAGKRLCVDGWSPAVNTLVKMCKTALRPPHCTECSDDSAGYVKLQGAAPPPSHMWAKARKWAEIAPWSSGMVGLGDSRLGAGSCFFFTLGFIMG